MVAEGGEQAVHGGGGEHACLDGVDGHVAEEAAENRGQQGRGRSPNGIDGARRLGGDGGDAGHGVAAVHGDCFDVGLDAGAAAGVRTGNGEHGGLRAGARAQVLRCGVWDVDYLGHGGCAGAQRGALYAPALLELPWGGIPFCFSGVSTPSVGFASEQNLERLTRQPRPARRLGADWGCQVSPYAAALRDCVLPPG